MRWIAFAVAVLVLIAVGIFVLPIRRVHSDIASILVSWTAPGDDGSVGTATSYDIRWRTVAPDTTSETAKSAWWSAATQVTGEPAPQVAGTPQSMAVLGQFLTGTRYYFVLRTTDDAGNVSGWSNVAVKFVPDDIPPAAIFDLRAQ